MNSSPPPAPALSVALSVYNGERFLAAAIESVLGQSMADFEFLILDDGSTDATPDIIRHYAARDARIRPIIRTNKGLIASLNELLATARAPLVARMDADDICLPERFARQVAFLAAHPDHGVVGCWTEDINEAGFPRPGCLLVHPESHEAFLAAIEAGGPLLCHPAVMYRREVVLGVGGYHAAFRHCEDYDLWLRLVAHTRIANIPERLFRYRHYGDQVSNRHATEQQVGAAVAKIAYDERRAGHPDPTEDLDRLPPVAELDMLFDHPGVASAVRARVVPGLLYSRNALRDEGFAIILQHIAEGGPHTGMWRTVLRLLRFGDALRAARLTCALLAN